MHKMQREKGLVHLVLTENGVVQKAEEDGHGTRVKMNTMSTG